MNRPVLEVSVEPTTTEPSLSLQRQHLSKHAEAIYEWPAFPKEGGAANGLARVDGLELDAARWLRSTITHPQLDWRNRAKLQRLIGQPRGKYLDAEARA